MESIDKSKVVAEIERLIETNKAFKKTWKWKFKWFYRTIVGRLEVLEGLKIFLNTLEVEEVDYERELSKYVSNGIHRFFPNVDDDYCKMDSVIWQDYVIETAKHFYELGLKAQKGE